MLILWEDLFEYLFISVCAVSVLTERLQSICQSLELKFLQNHNDLMIASPLDLFRVDIQLRDGVSSILTTTASDELVRCVTVSRNNDSTVSMTAFKLLNIKICNSIFFWYVTVTFCVRLHTIVWLKIWTR